MTKSNKIFNPVQKILEHSESNPKRCLCGKKVKFKRWRLNLCDECSENDNLRQFARSRTVSEIKDFPYEVRSMHEGVMTMYADQYFSHIKDSQTNPKKSKV